LAVALTGSPLTRIAAAWWEKAKASRPVAKNREIREGAIEVTRVCVEPQSYRSIRTDLSQTRKKVPGEAQISGKNE
jgi:hypothetical protein